MPYSLHHIALSVGNLEESIAWYGEIFGFQVEHIFEIPNEGQFAFLNNGSLRIELFCFKEATELPEYRKNVNDDLHVQGTKHICFSTEDIQTTFLELQKKGCTIVVQPKAGLSGGIYFFIQDPTGNLIELYQNKKPIS